MNGLFIFARERYGIRWLRFAPVLLCLVASSVAAQQLVQPESEYANKVGKAQQMGRLDEKTFGENISLFNGQLSFSVTDIAIP